MNIGARTCVDISSLEGLNNNILSLDRMNITDNMLKQLGKNIQIITLKNLDKITNVDALANIPHITLEYMEEVTNVNSLKNAKYLKLYRLNKITDVSGLGNVNYLDMMFMDGLMSIKIICNMNILRISACSKLRDINICGRVRMIYIMDSFGENYMNLSIDGMSNGKIYPPIEPIKINNTNDIYNELQYQSGKKYINLDSLEYVYLYGKRINNINLKNVENFIWVENLEYKDLSHLSGKVGSIRLEHIHKAPEPSLLDNVYNYLSSLTTTF